MRHATETVFSFPLNLCQIPVLVIPRFDNCPENTSISKIYKKRENVILYLDYTIQESLGFVLEQIHHNKYIKPEEATTLFLS